MWLYETLNWKDSVTLTFSTLAPAAKSPNPYQISGEGHEETTLILTFSSLPMSTYFQKIERRELPEELKALNPTNTYYVCSVNNHEIFNLLYDL